jgi:hypothetical protein
MLQFLYKHFNSSLYVDIVCKLTAYNDTGIIIEEETTSCVSPTYVVFLLLIIIPLLLLTHLPRSLELSSSFNRQHIITSVPHTELHLYCATALTGVPSKIPSRADNYSKYPAHITETYRNKTVLSSSINQSFNSLKHETSNLRPTHSQLTPNHMSTIHYNTDPTMSHHIFHVAILPTNIMCICSSHPIYICSADHIQHIYII